MLVRCLSAICVVMFTVALVMACMTLLIGRGKGANIGLAVAVFSMILTALAFGAARGAGQQQTGPLSRVLFACAGLTLVILSLVFLVLVGWGIAEEMCSCCPQTDHRPFHGGLELHEGAWATVAVVGDGVPTAVEWTVA